MANPNPDPLLTKSFLLKPLVWLQDVNDSEVSKAAEQPSLLAKSFHVEKGEK